MTIEFIEGFDRANTNTSLPLHGWSYISGTYAAATGRNSQGNALKQTGSGAGQIALNFPGGNLASRVVGCAMRQNSYDGSYPIFTFRDASTEQIALRRTGDGKLYVTRVATTLGTSAVIWASGDLGSWKYVEFEFTINNTTGSFNVYVDGVSVLSASGIDTQSTGNAFAGNMLVDFYANDQWEFDDLYIGDTRLGDRRVYSRSVVSDVAVAFTPSTGSSNYATVDDNPLSSSDYNEASAASLRDQFTIDALGAVPTVISAVSVNYAHTKLDSGARTMRGGIVSGGSTGNGATVSPVLSTIGAQQDIFATDPDTGTAWTIAGVDAIEPFYETVT